MTTTIKDVARYADVSIATVSRVLNNSCNVGSDIKARVLESIEKLNYRPNSMAQSLKRSSTNSIGVIITDFTNPFFMNITANLEKVIANAGYSMIIAAVGDSAAKEKDSIMFMEEKRVEGIVIASSGNNEDYLSELRDNGIPVVVIDRKSFSHRFDAVYIDKMKAMVKINEYLFKMGHRRIVLATGAKNLSTNFDRYLGYTRSYYNAGIPMDERLVYYGTFSEQFGREALNKAMNDPAKPTAIVSGSALIMEGIIKEAFTKKIKIPQDISLVSFGDIQMGEVITPRLTHTLAKPEEIGRITGEIILKKIKDQKSKVIESALDIEIVEGATVRHID